MEPVSIVGLTSGCVAVSRNLIEGVLAVKDLWNGIKDIDESTEAFAAELEAFHFALSVVKRQLSRSEAFSNNIQQWWSQKQLRALMMNATKTFTQLDKIARDISKDRSSMQQFRSYWRSCRTKQEVGHLRLRLQTYTAALNIPVIIMNIQSIPRSQVSPNQGALDGLTERIKKLDNTVMALAEQIQSLFLDQSSRGAIPAAQALECYEDSEELIEIAQDLRSKASSISSDSEDSRSTIFTISDEKKTQSGSSSIGTEYRHRGIEDWLRGHEDPQNQSQPRINIPKPPNNFDPEVKVILERYRFGKNLFEQKNYSVAVPHLRRTWETVKDYDKQISLPDDPSVWQDPMLQIFAKHEVRTEIQLYLAESLIEKGYPESTFTEAWSLLQDVLTAQLSTPNERELAAMSLVRLVETKDSDILQSVGRVPEPARQMPESARQMPESASILTQVLERSDVSGCAKGYASHVLAWTIFRDKLFYLANASYIGESHTRNMEAVKAHCIKAIRLRKESHGPEHRSYKESLALLIFLCAESNDSDLRFWLDELPLGTSINLMKYVIFDYTRFGYRYHRDLSLVKASLTQAQIEKLEHFYAALPPMPAPPMPATSMSEPAMPEHLEPMPSRPVLKKALQRGFFRSRDPSRKF